MDTMARRHRLQLVAAGLLSTLTACAALGRQAGPDAAPVAAPCSDTLNQAELGACWQQAAAQRESDVEAGANRAADQAGRIAGPMARDLALNAQEQWRRYRDAACALQGQLASGGSLTAAAVAACRWRLAGLRVDELGALVNDNTHEP